MEFHQEYHARSFEQLFEGLPTSVVGICKRKMMGFLNVFDYFKYCSGVVYTDEHGYDVEPWWQPEEDSDNGFSFDRTNPAFELAYNVHKIGYLSPFDHDCSSRVTVHDLHDELALHVKTKCAFIC